MKHYTDKNIYIGHHKKITNIFYHSMRNRTNEAMFWQLYFLFLTLRSWNLPICNFGTHALINLASDNQCHKIVISRNNVIITTLYFDIEHVFRHSNQIPKTLKKKKKKKKSLGPGLQCLLKFKVDLN